MAASEIQDPSAVEIAPQDAGPVTDEEGTKGFFTSGYPILVLRIVLGLIFLVLGAKKVMAEPQDFLKAVKEYQLLSSDPPLFNLVVVLVPWIEVVVGSALLLGVYLRGAALAATGMLAVFTIAIAVRAVGEQEATQVAFCALRFDCGCGQGVVNVCSKLWQNGSLILLSSAVVFSRSRLFCLQSR